MNSRCLDQCELIELTKSFACVAVRESVDVETIENILHTFAFEACKDDPKLEVTLECLRSLRNVVAGVETNQKAVASILQDKIDIWKFCDQLNPRVEKDQLTLNNLRCCIQLVGNLMVGQTSHQVKIFPSLRKLLQRIFTEVSDIKCLNYACMLLLTLIQNKDNLQPKMSNFDQDIAFFLPFLTEISESEEADFAYLCLESYLASPSFLPFLTSKERASLVPNLPKPIPMSTMSLLAKDFTFLTDFLLTTTLGSVSQLEPTHILLLTQLLAEAAGEEEYRAELQGQKSLVLNTLYLLKMVHEAGKAGVESFTSLSKLSDVQKRDEDDEETITEGPTFGFKDSLIHLLTNLAWDNTENKTLVGELEGIPLLLDCSQIDANPFITQRVVLAIKGLTNDHPVNQEILAGVKKIGAADEDLLQELGLKRDQEGRIGKIVK